MPSSRASCSEAGPSDDGAASFDVRDLSPAAEWRQLSDGGYSEVYKARLLGVTVAVKQATSRKKTSGEALMREVRYLRLAGAHPNIVTAFGAFAEGGRLHLVLEYARHCLRNDRVARQIDPILTLAGVLRALVRLHSLGIVHRDLKARNVLVAGENRAMLIDFGLACHVPQDPSDWVGRTVGTKKYRPPEMRDGRAATSAIDVYCFGLMVHKLLRQRERASLDSPPRSDGGRAERRDCKLLHDVGEHCTQHTPEDRPSAWNLLVRLQKHAGEAVERCNDTRTLVPLSAAAAAEAAAGGEGCGGGEGSGEDRSRSRGGSASADNHNTTGNKRRSRPEAEASAAKRGRPA
mmetsp:Transcript_11572/g.33444  ORF Transcript_11572/g.33444 Transcript_11572/m.33444 type:complete len:348 (-) Transcript_11572:1319-2362(-)